jgi:hypothetical protein
MAENLSKGRYLDGKVSLLHDEPRPDKLQEFGLRNDSLPPLDECEQHVIRTGTERNNLAVHAELAACRSQFKSTERQFVLHRIRVSDEVLGIYSSRLPLGTGLKNV